MSYEHSQGCKHGRWKGWAPHRAHTHLVRRRKLSGTKVDDSKDRAIVLIQLTAARESDNRRRAPASCCVHEHVEVGVGNARATRQIHRAGTRNLARAPTRHDKENYSATTRPCCHPSRNAYFDTAVMRVCAPREGRKRRCQEGPASSTSNKCRGGRSSHCVKSTSHAKTLCRTHTHTQPGVHHWGWCTCCTLAQAARTETSTRCRCSGTTGARWSSPRTFRCRSIPQCSLETRTMHRIH